MTAIEEIMHVQDLPGFTGWPQDEEVRDKVYEVQPSGCRG